MVLAIPFFGLMAALVLIGLSQTSAAQPSASGFRGFLDTIIHNNVVTTLTQVSAQALRWVTSKVAASHLKMVTAWLNHMARLWKEEFAASRSVAQATAAVAAELQRAIPIEAKAAAAPAHYLAKVANRHAIQARTEGRATAKELHRFRETTRARLKADAHAIDVTIPADIAGLRRRTREVEDAQAKERGAVGELEHGATKVWDWLRAHSRSAAFGAFAGAVGLALSRLGLGWLRCRSNPFTKSKNPCGLWSDLAGILAAAGIFGGVLDFRDIVKAAVELEGEATTAIEALVTLDEAAILDAAQAVAKAANAVAS